MPHAGAEAWQRHEANVVARRWSPRVGERAVVLWSSGYEGGSDLVKIGIGSHWANRRRPIVSLPNVLPLAARGMSFFSRTAKLGV